MVYSTKFLKILLVLGTVLIVVGGVMLLMPPKAVVAFKCMDVASQGFTELAKMGLQRAVELLV